MRLVLDAEAVNALLDPGHPAERKVRRAMEAARRLRREVAIATGTLAELYRGAGRNQALDALLARESGDGLLLRDTGRTLARLIGGYSPKPVPVPRCSQTPIPSPWQSKRVEASYRLPIPMTLPDWQPRTGLWSSNL